ncbi:hypothetical protein EP12_09265 [Alteromonas australica]|uniref:SprT family zinc-dependent metalloprotease n=1 Tax=Alteromonas australica TaxID=589873 RepID=UPI0005C3E2A8|nr:hypothetical protein EP12_09265 [Alteromonas australica]
MEKCVADLYQRAEAYFARTFPRPTLSFRRSGRNAGTAFLQQNRINLNPILYKENQAAFLTDVIAHEISHLLVWQLFGKVAPHGIQWQTIMVKVFNVPPNTTHQFNVSDVVGETFSYRCQCSEHALSVRRHKKIERGAQYRCKRCGETLTAI